MDIKSDRLNGGAGRDDVESGKGEKKGGAPGGILRKLHMAAFIIMVIAVTFIYVPLVFLLAIVSRRLARKAAREWNRRVLGIGGVRVKVTGKEKLDKSERYVFMSNHQSALDIPIIYMGIGEQISFIAKKELFMIPFFGWAMGVVGHISIDRENARKAHASIAKAVQKLRRENVSLVLFPEGTRSKDGKVLEFKTASFTLALQAGVRLVPVAIKGAIDRLPPKSSRIVPGEVILEIGDPISVEELAGQSKSDICVRVHAIIKSMAENT
ncbi:MAG: 1-acyl-sn-glycerol-3-phosphate acyltransferase [Chitinispirillia bacterium]|nr:1-acyl-sn-glycerol-3-phosphate acyltransferase [Chitinispirillia bacterium]